MARAVRVVFLPERATTDTVREVLPRAKLFLRDLGPGGSLLNQAERKPCTVVFFVRYLKTVRSKASAPEPKRFASLQGELERDGTKLKFVPLEPVTLEHDPVPPPDEKADPRRTKPLEYELDFAPEDFIGVGPRRLKIPRVPDREARFVEISLELSIDGALEMPLAASDVWDIPYAPLDRKVTWSVFGPGAPKQSELVVKESEDVVALGTIPEGEDPRFDLTELPPDKEYEVGLATKGLLLAAPLKFNIRELETALLREDRNALAKTIVSVEKPLPEPLQDTEDHDFGDLPFDEKPAFRCLCYFAIFHQVSDNAFKIAAETWAPIMMRDVGFNPKRDLLLLLEVSTETDFKNAWQEIHDKTKAAGAQIIEGHLFTHASKGDKNDGLEFRADAKVNDGTLSRQEIAALAKLPWHPSFGLLTLEGCLTGAREGIFGDRGWCPAEEFAKNQGVTAFGQLGKAFFSSRLEQFVEVRVDERGNIVDDKIFLQAYNRGSNNPLGDGARIPPARFKP